MAEQAERMKSPEWQMWDAWLRIQRDRNDIVGQLARDWAQDVEHGCARNVRSLSGMDRHIERGHRDALEALAARHQAYNEFRQALALFRERLN